MLVTCDSKISFGFNGEEMVSQRIFSLGNKQKTDKRFKSVVWTSFFILDCINDLQHNFNEGLTEVIEECFPVCYSGKNISI